MKSALALIFAALVATATGEDMIRTAKALDELLTSGRCEIRPFFLKGQILQACTPHGKSFYLFDGTDVVWLVDNTHWPQLPFRAGDVVQASGRTQRRPQGCINPDCETLSRIGHQPLPDPRTTTIRTLLNEHRHGFEYVKVHGVVRDVIQDDIDPIYKSLVLTDDKLSLYVSLKCTDEETLRLQALIGATISVDGLIRTDLCFDPTKPSNSSRGNRSISGPLLTIADPSAIHILSPAPQNPFDVPPITELRPVWPEDLSSTSRHRVEGYVVTAARKNGFLLQLENGRLVNVDLAGTHKPKTGDTVVAAGIPFTDLYRINLARAIWKPAPRPQAPLQAPPDFLSIADLLTDGRGHSEFKISKHGTAIRVQGIVRSLPSPGEAERLVTLDQDGALLSVIAEPGSDPFAPLSLGASIEATGICLMDVEPWYPGKVLPQVTGVRLVVRTSGDIRILSRPSWWTPQRILILAGLFALAALVVGLWNITLRTLVIRRSRALLREQAKRLTETLRVEERTRLATELHDTVAQDLSGLSLQLDAAGRLADSDPVTMKSILSFTSKALLACRRELRDCLWDLRSQALDEADMNAAIRRALAPHLGDAQLITRFNVPRRKLTDHTVHTVLRILGELTGNAVRHGKATTIRIAGSFDDEGLKFSCSDNGCGFDVAQAPGSADGHFGLQGIRDRIRTFNGSFKLTSAPSKGTKAIVHLRPTPLET